MVPAIRLAKPEEVDLIREIEDVAGLRYTKAGLPPDLEGLPHEVIVQAHGEQLLWVVAEDDTPIGFALCWLRPDALHLRELDVLPDRMGQGLGRRLVEHVAQEAIRRRLARVTLTTFRDVPWNAPLYRSWAFRELAHSAQPTWLQEIRQEEDATELNQWPRVAMARELRALSP